MRFPSVASTLLVSAAVSMLASGCGGKTDRAPVVTSQPPGSSGGDMIPEPPPPRTDPRPMPPTPPVDTGEDLEAYGDPLGISGVDLDTLNSREIPILADVPFGFDSASLDARGRAILDGHAEVLNDYPDMSIMIEGHCDERGTVEYNLALGERRANQAYNYLMSLGIASSRMRTITYGKEFPADPGHNEQAWARNRRARFEITAK